MLLWIVLAPVHALAEVLYEEGDARVELSGYLEGRAIHAFDRESPEENPSTELGLELKAAAASWNTLKIFLQGVQDGKVMDPGNGRLFNEPDLVYQDKNPSVDIDEAYVDLYGGSVDVRMGIQKFAWGRLDEINPTDMLNTEDLTGGPVIDEIDRKIGVPSVKVNLYSDLANVELGWVPRYVPYRLPTAEERWFPRVLVPPQTIDPGMYVGDIPVQATYRDMELPPFTLGNSEGGVRISRHIAGWDVSVCWFTGYDIMPLTRVPVDLDVELANPLALDYDVTARVTLVPEIHRMQVYGADFTTTVSSFTLRGEYAYFHNKYYNRRLDSVLDEFITRERMNDILTDFLEEYLASRGEASFQTFHLEPQTTLQMDSMKYGLGLDYIHGDTSVSVQCIQEFIPDYDADKPVYFNKKGVDTLFTLLFKQFFLQNTMEFNLRTAYDVEFQDFMVRPSVKYGFTNTLQGTIGCLIIGGPDDDSLLGQYRDNDEVYAMLRCSF